MVDISQKGVSAFQGVSRRFICNGAGVSSRRFKKPPLGGFETLGTHRPKTMKRFMVEQVP
jgi:hypothetical protein